MRNSPTRLDADYGVEFVDLKVEPEGEYPVVVRLRKVANGTESTVRAKYVAGCDGARSRVRDSIGAVPSGDFANHAQAALDILVAADSRLYQIDALHNLGNAQLALGHWTEAQQAFERVEALAREIDVSTKVPNALEGQARVALARGDLATAMSAVQQLLDYVGDGDPVPSAASLVGTEEHRIRMTLHEVWRRARDPRADAALVEAHRALMERWKPNSPAPLVAIAGAIAASWFFGLKALGVSIVGLIPTGLPPLTLPDLGMVAALAPGALGIALMSFTETIAAGRAFAHPNDPAINANRELVATGAANLGGALLGAMPAGGGTSQTAVVRSAGGVSQKASLVTAAAALATMLLLAPILGLLPNATLAAVVIVYSVGLIQPGEFRAIRGVRSMEFRWALVACAGVLVFGTLKGIVVAIIVSMIGLAGQTAQPRVSVIGRKRSADVLRPLSPEHPDDETFEGLLIVRPEGRLFFVNAQYVADRIHELVAKHAPRVLAVDMFWGGFETIVGLAPGQ